MSEIPFEEIVRITPSLTPAEWEQLGGEKQTPPGQLLE